jgi:hypothetical protein
MLKAALALSVAVCILPPVCLDKALAQSARSTSTRWISTLCLVKSTIT